MAFATMPALDDRFGAATLALMCAAMAALCVGSVYLVRNADVGQTWPLIATDALTLLLLVPVVAVASGIEVADAQLAGQADNFAASAVAVIAVTIIIGLTATVLSFRSPSLGQLALLPATLIVAAAIAGADRFSAGTLAQGLSVAWMVAALLTLVEGLSGAHIRPLLPASGFSIFAIAVALISRNGTAAHVSTTNAAIALIVTAIAGGVLLLVPGFSARMQAHVTVSTDTKE
jgi:hypothetical protein